MLSEYEKQVLWEAPDLWIREPYQNLEQFLESLGDEKKANTIRELISNGYLEPPIIRMLSAGIRPIASIGLLKITAKGNEAL
ncbi:hypothetical protein FAI40_02640 [Acetobacteraceae bacterium]|nr:hypothetical protein FAI40_02640 [Acetobacteraceae bacterium]